MPPINASLTANGYYVPPLMGLLTDATIQGVPLVGNTLTAVFNTNRTYTGIQWTRTATAAGSMPAAISGATSSTYTLTSADSGYLIGFTTTGNVYTPVAVLATTPPVAPVITQAPVLNANVAGQPVTWSAGTATGTPAPAITYLLRMENIPRAVNSGDFSNAQAGYTMWVEMRASNAAGTVMANSNAIVVTTPSGVIPTPLISTPTAISVAAAYTVSGGSATQQWILDGADVSGATSPTYIQAFADAAKVLKVRAPASGGATSLGALPGMQNWKASNTVNLRAIRAGGVRGRLLAWGDSYLQGTGANGDAYDHDHTYCWFTRLAASLAASGFPAIDSAGSASCKASTNTPQQTALADPRYVVPSSLTAHLQNYNTYGGVPWFFSTAGHQYIFTPGVPFDRVDLVYIRNTSSGILNIYLDNSTTVFQSINCGGAIAVGVLRDLVVPSGTTSVRVAYGGSGNTYPLLINTRLSTAPGFEVINGGAGGLPLSTMAIPTSTAVDANTWNSRAVLKAYLDTSAKNVIVVNGWYNDYSIQVAADSSASAVAAALTTTQNNLRTVLAEAKTYGDVIYANYEALDTGTIASATFRQWSDAMLAIAINEYDLPVLDMSRVFTDRSLYTSYYYDTLHLGATGHPVVANVVGKQLIQPFV